MFTRGRKRKGSREKPDGVCRACVCQRRTTQVGREKRRLANEREERSAGGGIRLAREEEGSSRWNSDGDIVEAHIHIQTPYTLASGCTLSRQARALQTARLPPRTFGKINRIQEKPVVRQASGALSSSALIFPLFLSLSLHLFLSLPSPLYLSISLLPLFHPLPSLPLVACLTRTRGIRVRHCSRQREGELAYIHWRSTEIGGMRARTTAKDGDKDKRSEREARGKEERRRIVCERIR